jgi:hypothetical protein
VKSGLFWWNGDPVTAADLSHYLEANLREIVATKSAGLWETPEFSAAPSESLVTVKWQSPPKFGPLVLADVSFWRKAGSRSETNFNFECAGSYVAERTPLGINLRPSPQYGSDRDTIRLLADDAGQDGKIPWLRFRKAATIGTNPIARSPDQPPKCDSRLDLPFATMIEWNSASPMAGTPEQRELFAGLIPKGALLRSGAGGYGDLISAPIPRSHPGYNAEVKVQAFKPLSPHAMADALTKMPGLRGNGKDGAGRAKQAEVSIGTYGNNSEIVKSVIADSFQGAGLHIDYFPAENQPAGKFDGYLYVARLPGPESNLLPTFHSKAKGSLHNDLTGGDTLDKALEDYLHGLSHGRFDPILLKKIHRELDRFEFMTVVQHHSACLVTSQNFGSNPGTVSINDPDWFRKIVAAR